MAINLTYIEFCTSLILLYRYFLRSEAISSLITNLAPGRGHKAHGRRPATVLYHCILA
jgi:hypothetical protein